jgi:hypothetical protein
MVMVASVDSPYFGDTSAWYHRSYQNILDDVDEYLVTLAEVLPDTPSWAFAPRCKHKTVALTTGSHELSASALAIFAPNSAEFVGETVASAARIWNLRSDELTPSPTTPPGGPFPGDGSKSKPTAKKRAAKKKRRKQTAKA